MSARQLPVGLGAVVTGGGGGLGRALAQALARRQARVVVSDIDADAAEATAELLRAGGGAARAVVCDVADRGAVMALAETARGWLGAVDVVCNNAGVSVAGPFEDLDHADWRWIVDINVWGVVHGCEAFVPAMKTAGRGWVLNVASAAGLLTPPGMTPYAMTKAAVVGLSESLYAELKPFGVKVTALCPTFFQTDIMASGRSTPDAQRDAAVAKLMAKSKLQADDVARVALEHLAGGKLYAVPMNDGRLGWRLKRLRPQAFHDMLSRKLVGNKARS